MKYKVISTLTFLSISISISMTSMMSGSVHASGLHAHEHKMTEKEMHQHGGEESPAGKPANEMDATKTIKVVTKDSMRYVFSPEPDIKTGDIVTFIITNEGQIPHEFSIGDKTEQDAHRKMMQKMPGMVHEDGNTITVKPGETKKLTWFFSNTNKGSNEVLFACNIPGHFEAGMFHKMTVSQQGKKIQPENVKHHDMSSHHHE